MKTGKIAAVIVSASLLASASFAAETPLPAGKPAGTRQANLMAMGPIFWVGLAAIAAGIGFAVSNNKSSTATTGTGS